MRAWIVVCICLVAALTLGACTNDDGAGVDMAGQRFLPEDLSIEVGTEVVFTNSSVEAHSITAYEDALPQGAGYFASGGFDTESEARSEPARSLLRQGETFSVTLTEPGTYRYFCIPHEDAGMVGRIVVEG